MVANKSDKIELQAEPRSVLGSRVRALRQSGYIPAILYGKGQEAMPLQFPKKDFMRAFQEAGESTLVYVKVGGQSYPTIIHDVSRDKIKDDVIHADFYKVSLSEKIKAKVPVVFTGESPVVKDLAGVFIRNLNELAVEALPQNLPHEILVDISSLKNFGDQILVRHVNLGKDIVIETDSETIIATVQAPKSEEELAAELAAPTAGVEEVKVIEKEKKEETPESETADTVSEKSQ